jgi:hypothetical protein
MHCVLLLVAWLLCALVDLELESLLIFCEASLEVGGGLLAVLGSYKVWIVGEVFAAEV